MLDRFLWGLNGLLCGAIGVIMLLMADKALSIGNLPFALFATLAGLSSVGVGIYLVVDVLRARE